MIERNEVNWRIETEIIRRIERHDVTRRIGRNEVTQRRQRNEVIMRQLARRREERSNQDDTLSSKHPHSNYHLNITASDQNDCFTISFQVQSWSGTRDFWTIAP